MTDAQKAPYVAKSQKDVQREKTELERYNKTIELQTKAKAGIQKTQKKKKGKSMHTTSMPPLLSPVLTRVSIPIAEGKGDSDEESDG